MKENGSKLIASYGAKVTEGKKVNRVGRSSEIIT
jgi:hypothetical protein